MTENKTFPVKSPTTDYTCIIGFYNGIILAILTIITFSIAILTPPLSGPFCPGSCFGYPYNDIIPFPERLSLDVSSNFNGGAFFNIDGLHPSLRIRS